MPTPKQADEAAPKQSWPNTPEQTVLDASIEINHKTGRIYVNLVKEEDIKRLGMVTILRIYGLNTPIPHDQMLDLNLRQGQYEGERVLPESAIKKIINDATPLADRANG